MSYRPLAFVATALAHRFAGSRCDGFLVAGFARGYSAEKTVGEAAQCQALRLLPSIVFGTMPHVAAYGILAVQALFFFLGGSSGSAAITIMC